MNLIHEVNNPDLYNFFPQSKCPSTTGTLGPSWPRTDVCQTRSASWSSPSSCFTGNIRKFPGTTFSKKLLCPGPDLFRGVTFWVVSTVVSGILFACFSTVDCINTACSFLLWRHSCSKKFQLSRKVHFLRVGLLLSSHSFTKIYIVGIHSILKILNLL